MHLSDTRKRSYVINHNLIPVFNNEHRRNCAKPVPHGNHSNIGEMVHLKQTRIHIPRILSFKENGSKQLQQIKASKTKSGVGHISNLAITARSFEQLSSIMIIQMAVSNSIQKNGALFGTTCLRRRLRNELLFERPGFAACGASDGSGGLLSTMAPGSFPSSATGGDSMLF